MFETIDLWENSKKKAQNTFKFLKKLEISAQNWLKFRKKYHIFETFRLISEVWDSSLRWLKTNKNNLYITGCSKVINKELKI